MKKPMRALLWRWCSGILGSPALQLFLIVAAFVAAALITLAQMNARFPGIAPDVVSVMTAAALAGITAHYALGAFRQRRETERTSKAQIRPLILATRMSPKGELGIFAADEGMNKAINVTNVGQGHARHVNVRLNPPAKAQAFDLSTTDFPVIHEESPQPFLWRMEIPPGARRQWDIQGSFCKPGDQWRYLYAEYEDIWGNAYYTIQSGYSVHTGEIADLGRNRKPDDDPLWSDKTRRLIDLLDPCLADWVREQQAAYWFRHGREGQAVLL